MAKEFGLRELKVSFNFTANSPTKSAKILFNRLEPIALSKPIGLIERECHKHDTKYATQKTSPYQEALKGTLGSRLSTVQRQKKSRSITLLILVKIVLEPKSKRRLV